MGVLGESEKRKVESENWEKAGKQANRQAGKQASRQAGKQASREKKS
jgi:hypothetical protein